jgi:hypothetical protein
MMWTKQFGNPVPHGIRIDFGWLHMDPHWEYGSEYKWEERPIKKEKVEKCNVFNLWMVFYEGWRFLL